MLRARGPTNSPGSFRIGATLGRLGFLFARNDTSAEEGRSRERYRRASVTATSSLISRVLLAVISLVSVPLTISYLGRERYGMWVAIPALLVNIMETPSGLHCLVAMVSYAQNGEDVLLRRVFGNRKEAVYIDLSQPRTKAA